MKCERFIWLLLIRMGLKHFKRRLLTGYFQIGQSAVLGKKFENCQPRR